MADAAPPEGTWDSGWDGHERAQLLRMAAWPLPLKLQWLEEAQRLAEHLQTQRKPPPADEPPSGTARERQP
jgi:hypothetical protein